MTLKRANNRDELAKLRLQPLDGAPNLVARLPCQFKPEATAALLRALLFRIDKKDERVDDVEDELKNAICDLRVSIFIINKFFVLKT